MRRILWAASLFMTSTAFAADVISAAYDGVYTALAERNPALSSGSCEAIAVGKVTIAQGNLRSAPSSTTAWLTGIITEDGHVKGFMARPGGPRRPLEGRLAGDTISAGFIEPDAQANTMCAWQVELKRAP
ncbi:MAG: hypothetical protein K1X51_00335 [Rhodospirillaceae bacterium]|nr:hypothetical protein [Rhodospirillaceae bacterium]